MLHTILLRLSLFIGITLFTFFGGMNVYKKEIILFSLHRIIPDATIECDTIEGFFPLTITVTNLKLSSPTVGKISAQLLQTDLSLLQLFTHRPYPKKTLLSIDTLFIEELRIERPQIVIDERHKDRTELDETRRILHPRVIIKHFDIKGVYASSPSLAEPPVAFSLKGSYLYDTADFSYTVHYNSFYNEGFIGLTKMHALHLATELYGVPVSLKTNLSNLKHISSFVNVGPYRLNASVTDHKESLTLTLQQEECPQNTMILSWDKDRRITLQQLDLAPPFGPYRLILTHPSTFDVEKKNFLNATHFTLNKQRITVSHLGFSPNLSGDIKAESIDLDLLKKEVPHLDFEGKLDFTATLSGHLHDPHIEAHLRSGKIKHKTICQLKITKSSLKALYHQKKLVLDGFIDGKNNLTLKIKGFATLKSLDINIAIDGYLRNFKKLFPLEDRIDGHVKGRFDLLGSPFDPKVTGELSLHKGFYENYLVGTHIKDISGKVILKDNHATFYLNGLDDFKGILKGKGQICLKDQSGDIHLSLSQFFLAQSDLFTSKANGTLFVNLGKKTITGELKLDPVVVDIDQLTPSATPKIHFINEIKKENEEKDRDRDHSKESPNVNFNFNISLTPEKHIIVRGFGIESTWKGTMKIQGRTPDFVGKFFLDKGTIDITGRVLKFTKGDITFDHKINEPYLNLEVAKKIDGYDIYVQLQGRPLDPKFTFLSSPALSQEEVLALILLGRTSASTSLGQLFDISTSLSSLSSAGQDKSVFTTFRKVFGIEALEIKKQDQTNLSESPQAISIRKQISPDFNLVIEQSLNTTEGESKNSKAIIEKQLSDQWNLEFDVSTNKSSSVGLNWTKRY